MTLGVPRAMGALLLLALTTIVAAAGSSTASAAPRLADSFDARSAPLAGRTGWTRAQGRPRIVDGRSADGGASLRTPRARGAHYIERRLNRPARRLSIAFSFHRTRRGPSGLIRFATNRLTLVDNGRGRLTLIHRGRRIPAARTGRAGEWNRVKVQLDARRYRVRIFVGGSPRGRWIRVRGLRAENRIRLGTPNALRGPVWFDAVNTPLPLPPPPAAADPAPPASEPAPPPVRPEPEDTTPATQTTVGSHGSLWTVNGRPVNPGSPSEGTLQSARVVQGIWDDENDASRHLWAYPDGPWDPERNLSGLIAAMPVYAAHGLDAITVSLQGGSPTRGDLPGGTWEGTRQTPIATAFATDGTFKNAWRSRAERAIEAADANGLVVILTVLYFGQAHRFDDEAAVRRAVLGVADWLRESEYANVVLEVGNEMGAYNYGGFELLNTTRGLPGLISEIKERHRGLLVSTSHANTRGRTREIDQDLLDAVDVLLIHGNTESDGEMEGDVEWLRERFDGPIHVNEDTAKHIDDERFALLTGLEVGNGLYDQTGFQSPPTVWSLDTDRKRDYFDRVRGATTPAPGPGS